MTVQLHKRITGKDLFVSQPWSECHILARAGFHTAGWEPQPCLPKGREQMLPSIFLQAGLTGRGVPESQSRILGSFNKKLRHHRLQWLTLLMHPMNWSHLSFPNQVSSTSAQLSFAAGWFFLVRGCPAHCTIFISNHGLYAVDTNSNSPAVLPKNVSRHCQISPHVCACSVTSLCPILCDPMDHSMPGSSIHGIV